jgi:hypothetical protein
MTANQNPSKRIIGNQKAVGKRIREVLDKITLDVWGIERKITENSHRYFKRVSKERNLPAEQLSLSIGHTGDEVSFWLCHLNTPLSPVNSTELLELLGMTGLIPKLIEDHIEEYIHDLSYIQCIPLEHIVIKIFTEQQLAKFELYKNTEFLRAIEVREVLKYFAL